jgi:hypothetical protein
MHHASAASGFLFLKWALIQPQESILQKLLAVKTQLTPFSAMVSLAVYVNHLVYRFFLSYNPRVLRVQV